MTVHLPLLPSDVPSIAIGEDYRIRAANDAYVRAYADGSGGTANRLEAADGSASVVGRYCYDVSHQYSSPCDENGESCPLQAARQSGVPSRVFHVHHHRDGEEHVDVLLRPTHDGREALYIEEIQSIQGVRGVSRGDFVGRGPAFRALLGMLRRVATTDSPVLLHGLPGTGKATAARALHSMSRRAAGPFVALRAAPSGAEEFDREVYGSDGPGRRRGLLESARSGTLFIEDVTSVPLASQTRLLRAIEDGTFRREKSNEVLRSDARFVFSSESDLREQNVRERMKEGFLARVRGFPIPIPSLAERREDIPLICKAYVSQRWPGRSLSGGVLARLQAGHYPANVKELILLIDRLMIASDSREISAAELPEDIFDEMAETGPAFRVASVVPLADVEARYVAWAAQQRSERRALAQELGVSERTLYRLLAPQKRPPAR